MQYGVYRKVQASGKGKGGGVGELYQFIGLARDHYDGHHVVIYIPLRIEPEWAGTIRLCVINRDEFERMFEYVGEGLPPVN
jgi:hypothetical protein